MKSTILLCALLGLGLAACERKSDDRTHEQRSGGTDFAPDNTRQNARDSDAGALTSGDQAENDTDRGITKQVRQDVMKQDSLSTDAKNIKIITNNGVVTLRGPVKTEAEKTDIGLLAQRVVGVKKVDNQLESESY